MGSDLFSLNALVLELNSKLKGAKISKIQQPEVDEIRLFLHTKESNPCLLLSCNSQEPRVHITNTKKISPKVAPNLLMLLRKYISVGFIESVSIFNDDRIIDIKIIAKNELQIESSFHLFIEIMNRYSNIVLTDSNLIIIDAVKHLPLDIARDHVVLKGVKYAPVKQSKISFLSDFESVFKNYINGEDLHKFILDNISGFSGITVSEILYRSDWENSHDLLKVIDTINSFKNLSLELKSNVTYNNVFPIVYKSLQDKEVKFVDSMSIGFDELFTGVDQDLRNKQRLKTLSQMANRLHKKVEKNIQIDLDKLNDCEDMERFRIYGELIVNNIYKLNKGDKELKCLNYYTNEDVVIPLDTKLTPSLNSKSYYTKYNKLKRTKEFVINKLEEDRILLDYILSIEDEIENLPYDSPYNSIEEELMMIGGNKKQQKKKGKNKEEIKDPPFIYLLDGFYIYKGKNNVQNNELTFKLAKPNDIWMHLKNEHGAHTIIVTDGKEVPEKIIKFAAELTASNKNAQMDVDYTEKKNVKRQPNSHLGQVIYVNYKTIKVSPDEHLEYLIKH